MSILYFNSEGFRELKAVSSHLFYLIRLRLSIARLDVDDLDNSLFEINPMTSFSSARLEPSALENIAEVFESEILV